MGFGGSQKPSVMAVPPPAPVMPGLNSSFMSLFGGTGGAGATAVTTLQDTAAGKAGSPGSATDVMELFDAIKAASGRTQMEGQARLQSSFASSGMAGSTDMMRALSSYNIDYGAQLNQTLSDLLFKSTESAKGRQLAAAGALEETFGNAAMAFAPTGQVVGGAQNSNLGGSLLGAGSQLGGTLLMLGALGFL